MATPLTDFLLTLARDPGQVTNFRSSTASAKTAMKAAGLSDQHQTILLSGNAEEISNAVKSELPSIPGALRVCILAMVNQPGGD